jgi:anti-anti-sigma factor
MSNAPDDLTLRQVEDVLIAHFEVDNLLSLTEVSTVGNRLTAMVHEDPARHLVLDLGKVRYSGSAALGMLISLSKALLERKCRLILTGTEHIDSLLKISRTRAVFEVAPNADAAIAALKKS